MTDLTKEDQAAYEAWYYSQSADMTRHDYAWQAACAYKEKRIAELEKDKAGYKRAAEYWKWNYDHISKGGMEKCVSFIRHGAGHQTQTRCEVIGPHTIHHATFGEFDTYEEWTDEQIKEGGGDICEWEPQDQRRHLYGTSCGMKDVLRPYPNNIGELVHDYCGKPIHISEGGGDLDVCPWCGEVENWTLRLNGERICNKCDNVIEHLPPKETEGGGDD